MPEQRRKASPQTAPAGAVLLLLVVVTAGAVALAREEHPGRFLLAALHGGKFEEVGTGVFQRSANDCGPAALAHCLRRLGEEAPYPDPDGRVVLGRRGCRLDALAEEAERKGRVARLRRFPPERAALTELVAPSIVHVREGHFLVFEELTGAGRVVLHDPALGRISHSERTFRRRWTGHVLDFPEGREAEPIRSDSPAPPAAP